MAVAGNKKEIYGREIQNLEQKIQTLTSQGNFIIPFIPNLFWLNLFVGGAEQQIQEIKAEIEKLQNKINAEEEKFKNWKVLKKYFIISCKSMNSWFLFSGWKCEKKTQLRTFPCQHVAYFSRKEWVDASCTKS